MGARSYGAYQPLVAAGNVDVGRLILSNYDIGLVIFAAALAAGLWWALKYTRYGRLLNVVIFDRETAAAFGVNVTVVYTVTFIVGAMLGALGGAVMAPKISVTLGIGVEVIVLAFAVVAIGGMGSVAGSVIGASVLSGLPELLRPVREYSDLIYTLILLAFLLFMPHGLVIVWDFVRLRARRALARRAAQ